MRYFIHTLGCQMNISDSQRIASKLDEIGYKPAPVKDADLVVINGCSVRQHAVDRIWGSAKNYKNEKKNILITGCVTEADRKKFNKKNIVFFNIKNLPKLEEIIKKSFKNSIKAKTNYDLSIYDADYFHISPKLLSPSIKNRVAYIPIMTGCDNYCSYCVVPYTRGREVSRPMEDIIEEVNEAIECGYNEIMLLGQNVNSYGIKSEIRNTKSETNNKLQKTNKQNQNEKFVKLLETIDNLPGEFTFNFMSSNPHDMGNELIDCFSKLKKWPRELHLAMQSGDDEILRKMNRKINSSDFIKLVSKLKLKIKNLKLSTDIIVGFPGESKEQFENTVKACKKCGFTKAYISQYSPRSGTLSEKLKDNVLTEEKKRRWIILNDLINKPNKLPCGKPQGIPSGRVCIQTGFHPRGKPRGIQPVENKK